MFYAHNLGKFDGLFLLFDLMKSNYNIKTIMNDDNTVISLSIGSGKKILKFKDSYLFLRKGLAQLAKDFDVETQKGVFPYAFAKLATLNYMGPIPEAKFYNLSPDDYNKLAIEFNNKPWSFKEQTNIYLIQDVRSLLEILLKFNQVIFDQYSVNINRYNTIASLAMGIFTSNFYDLDSNLHIIKDVVEKEIRAGYYGGTTQVHTNYVNKAYYYDINSSYPASMLNPMPTGNAIFTTDTNLDNLFGFVNATIIAPTPEQLRVLTLPSKTPDGIEYRRGTFTGVWFSEELKDAISRGYKVTVNHAYVFNKTENVFKNYVESLFQMKSQNDLNPSVRITSKFLLNTLYGRLGMNSIEYKVRVMDTDRVTDIMSRYYWTNIASFGEKSLVRYGKLLDPTLLELLDRNEIPNNLLNAKNNGVVSSVPTAAATAAYARMALNKFTNIPDNPCIYTDTDSVVLPKPLDSKYLTKNIGSMKLEHVISEGIFIAPKTYAIRTESGDTVFRAKGVRQGLLKWSDYQALLQGRDLILNQSQFFRDFQKGSIVVRYFDYKLRGLQGRNLALVPYVQPTVGMVIYKEPNLALVVINPSGSTGPDETGVKPYYSLYWEQICKKLEDVLNELKAEHRDKSRDD
jgi:hypothetical protein